MKPNVTIIITCFNTEKYLQECLDSIINQSYTRWKIIFIDDASTDKSLAIAENLAALDSRIKILKNQKNLGHYASLNRALDQTDTAYFCRVDADDTVHKEYLSSCFKVISSTSEVAAVFVNFRNFDEHEESVEDFPVGLHDRAMDLSDLIPNGLLRQGQHYFYHKLSNYFRGIGLLRTETVLQLGGFEEWISEADILLYLKISCISKVYCINEPLYNYRKHESSITSNILNKGYYLYWKKKLLLNANEFFFNQQILNEYQYKKQEKSIIREYHRHMISLSRSPLKIFKFLKHMIQLLFNHLY